MKNNPLTSDSDSIEINQFYLLREKAAHIVKAARSATLANILAPLLCIPMFQDEVTPGFLNAWLAYMFVVVALRTWVVFNLRHTPENITDPMRDLNRMTFAVGIVGFGWGLGWILMAPELSMVNRMIYVYMTTAAMISSMFAYSVHRETFYAFTLPIMVPSISTVLWPTHIFPWPFTVGLATLYLVVLSIAKSFSHTYENSVGLRFRNEKLYQDLANERDQSLAANLAKSKFIAIASHDLRQPMHAVNVYLELMNLDKLSSEESKTFHKIKNSIATLNAMFDSLLNISKLDAYSWSVKKEKIDVQVLANEIHDAFVAQAKNKGLSLLVTGQKMHVFGDRLLMQQIINNLISNAIQYTEQGEIHVQFQDRQGQLVIAVKDTGCGLSEDDRAHIFNEFYRSERTRAWHDGLGLGLSIVQRLCGLIGATVQVTSSPGVGSTFTVSTAYDVFSTEDVGHTEAVSQHESLTHKNLLNKYIAIAEDDPIILEAYQQTLTSKGAHVLVLSLNDAALDAQLATIDRIDCILSDYRMGQTTGDVIIQKLRENFNEEIPAVIVTADTSPDRIALFGELNALVLHKPISFTEVTSAIEKSIRETQAH